MEATKKIKCGCRHEFQDKEHGVGIRVHNLAKKAHNGMPGYRCTVCKSVKPA
jgi:hypothetical protein